MEVLKVVILILQSGAIGDTYNIGGNSVLKNIDVVRIVCSILDDSVPNKFKDIYKYEQLITFVTDRVGHDIKYAIDATKINKELNWIPEETFETGIKKTVEWYLGNKSWCDRVKDRQGNVERLGVIKS